MRQRERDINDVSGQQGAVAKSDNDPPGQTILVKSFSNLGAMKGSFTDDCQNRPVDSPMKHGIVETRIHLVQGTIKTMRRSFEER